MRRPCSAAGPDGETPGADEPLANRAAASPKSERDYFPCRYLWMMELIKVW